MSDPDQRPLPPPREPAGPVFLHTRHYRQRRLVDAIRLLPVLALALFLLPLLWPRGEVADSRAIVYLFASWTVLILLSALLSHRLRSSRDSEEAEGRK
ncbi:hypothetical protein [Mesobacterium pallidum]|uniref:hypothetical protein n=1 Tax=Mesobacterium pallidum TaxID=2872037 RepID=UPI001EE1E65F|nr:hypothetical protein [Mesobacterium pallidum]